MTIKAANLGCGRLVFPIEKGDPMAAHVAYALDTICTAAYDDTVQWDNYDKVASPRINERLRAGAALKQLDLFRYPWDIPDNTYDILWLSHIAEHIPHKPELHGSAFISNGKSLAETMYFDEFDGWFLFFGECWRILKPGGKMCVLAPYGASIAGMSDPTHTRYLTPGSFGYFAIDKNAPFDYALPYAFEQIGEDSTVLKFTNETSDLARQRENMIAALEALPADNDRTVTQRAETLKQIGQLTDYLSGYASRHFNQISEFMFSFRPIK